MELDSEIKILIKAPLFLVISFSLSADVIYFEWIQQES